MPLKDRSFTHVAPKPQHFPKHSSRFRRFGGTDETRTNSNIPKGKKKDPTKERLLLKGHAGKLCRFSCWEATGGADDSKEHLLNI